MRGDYDDNEDAWCRDKRKSQVAGRVISDEDIRDEQFYTSKILGEKRDPPEDLCFRKRQQDKIEAHREEMETQRAPRRKTTSRNRNATSGNKSSRKTFSNKPQTSRKLVTQKHYGCEVKTERRVKDSMNKIANSFNDKEIIKRYMSPGTETNNSAMLFLANSLFSSNQYIFEFLHENGFFNPSSQYVVNTLASDFVTKSQRLSHAITSAERASGAAVRNMVVTCVNNFVATSNKLATVLEEDYAAKARAGAEVRDSVLNSIIQKRNQISASLYTYFQRTVDEDQSSLDNAITDKATEDTARFLEDAQKLTNFLNTEVEKELAGVANGIEVKGIARTNTFEATRSETRRKSLFRCHEKQSIAGDASDVLSTASSFLDFINGDNLSVMFDEDDRNARDSKVPEAHLDVIFERMNLSIPAENKVSRANSSTTDWGNTRQTKPPKLSMREKRQLLTIARSQARQARREKTLEKKKARAKERNQSSSDNHLWSKMNSIARYGKSTMAEI